jgi:O-acetyl-ADP-ribose deacetylase (regulator of RNase III)
LQDRFEINISEPLPFRELGSIDVQQINGPHANQLSYIIFATCVDQNNSSYDAIEKIINEIVSFSKKHPRLRDIAIPLLGTGAGRLDYIEVYKIFFQVFEKEANNFYFNGIRKNRS